MHDWIIYWEWRPLNWIGVLNKSDQNFQFKPTMMDHSSNTKVFKLPATHPNIDPCWCTRILLHYQRQIFWQICFSTHDVSYSIGDYPSDQGRVTFQPYCKPTCWSVFDVFKSIEFILYRCHNTLSRVLPDNCLSSCCFDKTVILITPFWSITKKQSYVVFISIIIVIWQ